MYFFLWLLLSGLLLLLKNLTVMCFTVAFAVLLKFGICWPSSICWFILSIQYEKFSVTVSSYISSAPFSLLQRLQLHKYSVAWSCPKAQWYSVHFFFNFFDLFLKKLFYFLILVFNFTILYWFLPFILNWRIIALQYCVGFCHISTCFIFDSFYFYFSKLSDLSFCDD